MEKCPRPNLFVLFREGLLQLGGLVEILRGDILDVGIGDGGLLGHIRFRCRCRYVGGGGGRRRRLERVVHSPGHRRGKSTTDGTASRGDDNLSVSGGRTPQHRLDVR